MKNTWKRVLSLMLAVLLVVGLIGCAKKEDKPADSQKEENKESAEDEEVTLLIRDNYSDAYNGIEAILQREYYDTLSERYPNVTLDLTHIAPDTYFTKIQALAASDELPDIFPSLLEANEEFYNAGLVKDLKPIFDADPEWRDSFAAGAFEDQTTADGAILACPYTTYVIGLIYYN